MSTYELPAEPDVDVLWTVSSDNVTRWNRLRDGWIRSELDADRVWPWQEVLTQGVVHDVHPGLFGAVPTPWSWDEDGWVIRDANQLPLEFGRDDSNLIVRAVNAYAEGLR